MKKVEEINDVHVEEVKEVAEHECCCEHHVCECGCEEQHSCCGEMHHEEHCCCGCGEHSCECTCDCGCSCGCNCECGCGCGMKSKHPMMMPIGPKPINICAILGFALSFSSSIAGLVLSLIGLSQLKERNEEGKGFAIAGIVISAAKFVLILFYIVLLFLLIVLSEQGVVYY